MKKKTSRLLAKRGAAGLLALNALLLGALGYVTFGPEATAQGFRARGHYHAVSINAPGAPAGTVIVVDEVNEQLIALSYNPSTKTLDGLGARDLAADASQFGRAR